MKWTEIGVGMLGATSVNWLVSRGYFAESLSAGEEWWEGRRRGLLMKTYVHDRMSGADGLGA